MMGGRAVMTGEGWELRLRLSISFLSYLSFPPNERRTPPAGRKLRLEVSPGGCLAEVAPALRGRGSS